MVPNSARSDTINIGPYSEELPGQHHQAIRFVSRKSKTNSSSMGSPNKSSSLQRAVSFDLEAKAIDR